MPGYQANPSTGGRVGVDQAPFLEGWSGCFLISLFYSFLHFFQQNLIQIINYLYSHTSHHLMNYKQLGFKCGLEIHQQLSGKKLFCSCPSINTDTSPDIHVERKLRAAAGETGEIDIAAEYEMSKDKSFIYEAHSSDCCLVELDEAPPNPVNQDALAIALEIALLLNCKIIDEIQFMRKTVVDGSNVSGFQRTALIGIDGHITTSKGNVGIPIILLEEEAAKKIKATDSSVTYRLDRLGIAMVEIATDASIKDPQHCKEVAEKIGMILRSTGKVKRGIGTIRQDVNVSIKGHTRVEVKGFQDLKSIPKVIENEITRQKSEKKSKPEVRKAEPDFSTIFLRPLPGAARLYPETDIPIFIPDLKNIKKSELIDEKIADLEQRYKISADLARELVKQQDINFYEYVKAFKHVEPSFIAHTLINTPKELKAKLNKQPNLNHKDIKEALNFLNQSLVSKEAVFQLLLDASQGKPMNISKYKKQDSEDIESEVKSIIKKKPGLSPGAYMGILMGKYRGKVDGKDLMTLINKNLK